MGVYVVGMHRSGTSALAGLLSALLELPAGRLAVESNPSGQWERPELRPALELLLTWRRATWSQPPPETTVLGPPAPLLAYSRRVFDRHCSGPFLWKDPRLCLTIDHWLSLPQAEPKVILINRRPDEVARSLQDRNGWASERGLALWERTTRNAVARLGGREIWVVDHATLMTDPDRAVADLAPWLGQTDPGAMARAVATIDRSRAPDPTIPAGHAGLPDAVPGAIAALAERLSGISGPARLDLDGIGPESPTTASILGRPSSLGLARRGLRALRAVPRRHPIEIAGAPVPPSSPRG